MATITCHWCGVEGEMINHGKWMRLPESWFYQDFGDYEPREMIVCSWICCEGVDELEKRREECQALYVKLHNDLPQHSSWVAYAAARAAMVGKYGPGWNKRACDELP